MKLTSYLHTVCIPLLPAILRFYQMVSAGNNGTHMQIGGNDLAKDYNIPQHVKEVDKIKFVQSTIAHLYF